MLIDLHCHTRYSGDTDLDPAMLIRAARAKGLDAICVTEHDSFLASEPVEEVAEREGFPVFRGVEINTDKGHILAFGVKDDSWKATKGYYSHMEDVRPVIEASGGILVPAHPFRMVGGSSAGGLLPEMDYIAAMEVVNGENNSAENDLAIDAWRHLGLPGTGGSDCHLARDVGRCATLFQTTVTSMDELIEEIRGGRIAPVHRDENGDFVAVDK